MHISDYNSTVCLLHHRIRNQTRGRPWGYFYPLYLTVGLLFTKLPHLKYAALNLKLRSVPLWDPDEDILGGLLRVKFDRLALKLRWKNHIAAIIDLTIFDYLPPMRTLTINLPSAIDLGDKEAKMAMASKLYELGKLTLGQAADLTGYSKETLWNC